MNVRIPDIDPLVHIGKKIDSEGMRWTVCERAYGMPDLVLYGGLEGWLWTSVDKPVTCLRCVVGWPRR